MGRAIGIVLAIFLLLVILGRCGRDDRTANLTADNVADGMANDVGLSAGDGASSSPPAEGENVPVPSDPQASYRLLEWRRMPNGHREAMTRRDGPSGTSFARREIDCDAMTFRYLGEGDTLEQALADSPNPGQMGELTSQSISTYVSEFVCRKAGR